MFLAKLVTGTAVTANNALDYSNVGVIATNGNVELNSAYDGLIINTQGWYKVRLQIVGTATGTSVGAVLSLNGTNVDATQVTLTTEASDSVEMYIEYPVHVLTAESPSQAILQFIVSGGITPTSGYVFVDRMD